jgi:hypothetical protein
VANTIRLNIASVSIDNVQAKVHQRNKDDLKLLGGMEETYLRLSKENLSGLRSPKRLPQRDMLGSSSGGVESADRKSFEHLWLCSSKKEQP